MLLALKWWLLERADRIYHTHPRLLGRHLGEWVCSTYGAGF